MFDENDGFFDHVAPPAAPSLNKDGTLRGKTTADATLEWHTKGDIRYRNQPLRPRPAGADVRDLAVEQGRLGQLPGVRPHLGDPLPWSSASGSWSRISAPGVVPSAAT